MDRRKERGEGKIGCIVSLLVLAAGIGVGLKVLPVLYSNYSLAEYAGEVAGKAGLYKIEGLQGDLRDKARELGVTEALARGAMTLSTTGNPTDGGICTVSLKYSREVDLYGYYKFTINTDDKIARKYVDAR
jgi:hypothetical protein